MDPLVWFIKCKIRKFLLNRRIEIGFLYLLMVEEIVAIRNQFYILPILEKLLLDYSRRCGGQATPAPETRGCVLFSQRISYSGEGMRGWEGVQGGGEAGGLL